MNPTCGRRIVSSEATEEEIRHIRTGTLDQVEAIAMLRAFDPGAWIRIAFDVTAVASKLRGEPFVRSVLDSGQTSQLMFARTFSDLINCSIHTVMEHLSDFLRGKFHIDVSPDYLSVALPHGIPLLGHYTLLELVFLCDIVDGDLMAFREQRTLLLLRVCTTVPAVVLSPNGASCLYYGVCTFSVPPTVYSWKLHYGMRLAKTEDGPYLRGVCRLGLFTHSNLIGISCYMS